MPPAVSWPANCKAEHKPILILAGKKLQAELPQLSIKAFGYRANEAQAMGC